MAKWKMAGQMAVAMREAERQAEMRRVLAEQHLETIQNGKILRKLARSRDRFGRLGKDSIIRDERMYKLVSLDITEEENKLHVSKSTYHQRLDARNLETLMYNVDKLDQAREERKMLISAIEMLNIKIRDVDLKLKEADKTLRQHSIDLTITRAVKNEKVERRAEVTEQKIGLQLAENRRLKDMIDHLEMERDNVMRLYNALDTELADLSKQLTGSTEKAKETYDQRDLNKRSKYKLIEHLDKNTAAFESDMQLLQFKIECLKRIERFMTSKNKYRPNMDRKRRIKSRSQLSASERDNLGYHNLMDDIKRTLKDDDIYRAVQVFIELQEENYMLFKNISDTREACNNLQLQTEEAKAEYKAMLKANMMNDQESMARKMELMEKIQTCRQQANKAEDLAAASDNIIHTYIAGILGIMDKLGYNASDLMRLSGIFKCVDERNVHVFLAEIERYVNHVFDLKSAADYVQWNEARKREITATNPELLPLRLPPPQRVVVVPPVHEEGEDVDDPLLPSEASQRPLEHTEMVRHVDEELNAHLDDPRPETSFSSNVGHGRPSRVSTATPPRLPADTRRIIDIDVL